MAVPIRFGRMPVVIVGAGALHLNGRMVDFELLAQHMLDPMEHGIRFVAGGDAGVQCNQWFAGNKRPGVQVVDVGHALERRQP